MRIGELSKRTRIPIRMLRYYEERGLLTPERTANGYRRYGDADVERAALVSSLIRAGLPTKLIIPMLQTPPADVDDDLVEAFAAELSRLDSRVQCMTMSRDAVAAHLSYLRGDRRLRVAG